MSAANFFASLRSESLLNIFASIGKFFGLEVYEQGLDKVRAPKNLSNSSVHLLLGFPDCSYFLLIQLEKHFKPLFTLLETRPDPSGKAESPNELLRIRKINIDQMQVLDDVYNMTMLDWDKLFSVLSGAGVPKQNASTPFNTSSGCHLGIQTSQVNIPNASNRGYRYNGSIYPNESRKRTFSDILKNIGILQDPEGIRFIKKRKIPAHFPQASPQTDIISKGKGYSYGGLITETNKGNAPYNVYTFLLLHVVSHCSLCIKHARLTSQMEALNIPYKEKAFLRDTSSNIWFQLLRARGNPEELVIHLRLGKPGSMSWDAKINDQHFRDLWDLEKGSNKTPWGSGVCITPKSNLHSHIHYDHEGVVLRYKSVEPDSMKKLAADITRLSNAKMFAPGMRKLLGKGLEVTDMLSEERRKMFKIEAVGLTSFWFSFGSRSLAHFAVEWEPEKEGCRTHVSPDQLWPHTKFLEEFINGGEVASLLDCIRLTAGPLHALAAETRPTRANPAPGAATCSLVNHGLAAPSLINAVVRGGPGIVPSSLPNDVSVVLCGPNWRCILYHKHFAVDMRCFAGDQVWLQPATPPKGGPSFWGSLPCPQFSQFIMEHVAQELSGLDANISGGQQTVVLANGNNPNPGPGAQLSSANGNRVNPSNSSAMPRAAANQVAGLTRVGNALLGGLPIRRFSGTGELNTATIGLGDDGGYGGGWVPLVALKKVLRGVLKYLGVLWLFWQLPDLLTEIFG